MRVEGSCLSEQREIIESESHSCSVRDTGVLLSFFRHSHGRALVNRLQFCANYKPMLAQRETIIRFHIMLFRG